MAPQGISQVVLAEFICRVQFVEASVADFPITERLFGCAKTEHRSSWLAPFPSPMSL